MNTPFNSLTESIAPLIPELAEAARRVLAGGHYLHGRETAAFEEEWAAYCGQRYAVACAHGVAAITLAVKAMRMREAVIQSNAIWQSAYALHAGGARVTCGEVDHDGRLAGPDPATAMVVTLYGRPPVGPELSCRLFDSAHCCGWKPPPHATVAWSFYPTKPLGSPGDGGAVTTNDLGLADELRALSVPVEGRRRPGQFVSRISEVQAAMGRVMLRHLDASIARRAETGAWYAKHLPPGVRRVERGRAADAYHLLPILCEDRDALAAFLAARGVGTKAHYPIPIYRYPAPWAAGGPHPNAERWCGRVLSLPCHAGLSEETVKYVCELVTRFLDERPG